MEIHPSQKDWIARVDMTKFMINSSIGQMTQFALFELNGGYLLLMLKEYQPQDSTPPGIWKFAQQALANLAEAHDVIIESHIFQTHHANKKRVAEPNLKSGDMVYLSTKNLNLPKGRARKLCSKYIRPYRMEDAHPEMSTYTLQLPIALQE